jgi:hypothetical protein
VSRLLFAICIFSFGLCSVGLVGCRGEGPKAEPAVKSNPPPERPTDPDSALYEQIRAASFQFGVVASSLEEALVTAQKLFQSSSFSAEEKAKLADVIAALDDNGGNVTELADTPPTLEMVKKDFAKYDERRLNMIAQAEDMMDDLTEALHTVDALAEGQDEGTRHALSGIEGLIQAALDDLAAAIESAGGKVSG